MTKRIAYLGMFTALAIVFSYLEALIPISIGIPGIKLGLANIVTLIVLYRMNQKDAFIVLMLRIILVGILFGNFSIVLYSLFGGLLSWIAMSLLKKKNWFSMTGVSVVGAVTHNLGQLLVAVCLVENGNVLFYVPILLVAGILAGMTIGIFGSFLIKHLPK